MAIYNVQEFIRHYAPREKQPLINAPLNQILDLNLPKELVLHHVPLVPNNLFNPSSSLTRNWVTNIRHYFVRDAQFRYGKVRKSNLQLGRVMQEYYRITPAVKRVTQLQRALMQLRDMVVLDYGLVPRMGIYSQNLLNRVWFFENLLATVVEQANQVDESRPQIIPVECTENWLPITSFRRALREIKVELVDDFQDLSLMWVLEMMRFLSGENTLLNKIKSDNVIFSFKVGLFAIEIPLGRMRILREASSADHMLAFYNLMSKLHQTLVKDEDDDDDEENETLTTTELSAENLVTNDPNQPVPSHIQARLEELVRAGVIKPGQRDRRIRQLKEMAEMEDPITGQPLQEVAQPVPVQQLQINPDLKVPVENSPVPKKALESTTTNFVKDYPKKLMQRDISAVIYSLRNAGIIVRNYSTEIESDALEDRQVLTFSLSPITGKDFTVRLDVPVIQPDGTYTIGGVHYSMNSQSVDVPIRKTKVNQAALTSYAGKIFIQRSPLAKHDYNRWLSSVIRKAGVQSTDKRVMNLRFGGFKVPNIPLPRTYSALMATVVSFDSGDYHFSFDYNRREENFGKAALNALEKNGAVVCGTYKGKPIAMSTDGHLIGGEQEGLQFLDALGGGFGVPPSDVAVFKSLNRRMPVVMFLGYLNGLDEVIKRLKTKSRLEPIDRRPTPEPGEIFVNFADERLYLKITNPIESMIWAGLKDMEAETQVTPYSEFNRKDGWISCLDMYRANVGHVKNWEQINDMFLDPITIDCLKMMKEPTNMQDLFIRCVDLIKDDAAPEESDTLYTRVRGLERIPGAIYKLLYDAVAAQRKATNPSNEPVSVPRTALLQALNTDSAVQLVSEINPIHNLKEQSALTKSGTGGRSARTLVKSSRVFGKNDLGFLSENTPDSGKVGIRGDLTPNASLANMRGFVKPYDKNVGATGFLSVTALTLPGMDRDDGKRMNLGAIQQSSIVPVVGGRQMPYITGYGNVIASRVSDFFVFKAEQDGTVTEVNDQWIRVTYADGREEGYQLGVKHGKVAGTIIPHQIVTDMKVGDKFKAGYILAWNKGFFTRDIWNPYNVTLLTGVPATVALKVGNDMLEDGSAVSEKFRANLASAVSYERAVVVNFDQVISSMVKLGDEVEHTTILATIEEAATAGLGNSNEALNALSKIANQTPRAKHSGTISKIECFYQGEIDEMSPSLQAIVKADNRRRLKVAKAINRGGAGSTGEVKHDAFIGGEKIAPGKVIIVFTLDHPLEFGAGDKQVTGNQLKSIPGRIMTGINQTEDRQDLDILFGAQSVNNRIVWSIIISGVYSTIGKVMGHNLADEWLADEVDEAA